MYYIIVCWGIVLWYCYTIRSYWDIILQYLYVTLWKYYIRMGSISEPYAGRRVRAVDLE